MKPRHLLVTLATLLVTNLADSQEPSTPPGWEDIRKVKMSGDLHAFWNVVGAPPHDAPALTHGFEPVHLLGDFSDYPGKQTRNIHTYVQRKRPATNPWDRPKYFKAIIRQNIGVIADKPNLFASGNAPFVHDIEFEFEQDIDKAWADPVARAASGVDTRETFQDAYLAEWAKWFYLPCQWGKEMLPDLPAGLYGPQPFRRDYWGIAGKDAAQIDGTHLLDAALWKHIDPHVDFYVASIYVFYDDPGSVFYIASNVEENFQRTRQYGDKPVYTYSWLRYHNGNPSLGNGELPAWLADASAVVPYFFGAKANVLWGWEPKSRETKLYGNLPVYTDSLARVAELSEKISRAVPTADDPPAHLQWKNKSPLVKRLKVSSSDDEWIVLAANPWQAEDENSSLDISCGSRTITVELQGRHSDIFHITGDQVTRLQVDYSRATEPVKHRTL